MSNLRSGTYGDYYGSFFGESSALTTEQMTVNVAYITKFLRANGWTDNSIAAICGNMQAESSLNPGRWQSEDVGNYNLGYGLVQWTPATKYINWCATEGIAPEDMDSGLKRILYELENNIQWIATNSYNYSFKSFSKSTAPPSILAAAFMLNYERPADQSASAQTNRGNRANIWYEYITGISGGGSGGSTTTKKKRKGFNFVLFNAE